MMCVSSAQAYTVTLGPSEIPSAPPETGYVCRLGCLQPFTVAQRSSSYVDAAPASGVITRWRVNGGSGPLALRVLEPSLTGDWVGAGTSAPATDLAGGPNATEIPISRGALIGADVGAGAFIGGDSSASADAEVLTWRGVVEEGGGGPAGDSRPGRLLLLNATVELTPVVTSVAPASGSTAGGDTVTITGKYLDSALNVVFGSRPATSFSVDLSGEQITARTPASTPGTADVQVSNLRSTSEAVAADRYTFAAPSTRGSVSVAGRRRAPAERNAGRDRVRSVNEQVALGQRAAAHQQRPDRHSLHLPPEPTGEHRPHFRARSSRPPARAGDASHAVTRTAPARSATAA